MITLGLLAFGILAQTPVAAQQPARAPDKQRVLVLDLRNDGARPEHARLVTDNIVVALSRFTQLEVVSSEDVRRMVQTEGEKQSMGCTDDSCLTEIASAMGAQLVVHGSIGRLESVTVVNLSLYDSKAGKSIGRDSIQVQRLDDLPYRVEDATARLVRPLLGASPTQNPSSGGSSLSSPGNQTPAPDAPRVNRVLAGSVAGAIGCCVGAPLFLLASLGGPCVLCLAGGGAVALAGAAGPVVGGLAGGAPISTVLIPAGVGAGVGGLAGGAAGLAIWLFATDQSFAFTGALLAAVPIGLLTGAAAGIATALLISDPAEPEPAPATAERALGKAPPNRYAVAW